MTVIAARKHSEKSSILFASDTQTTRGWNRVLPGQMELGKIHQVNGLTIGGSGKRSQSQWLFRFARNHAPLEANEVDISEFFLEFVEWMRKKDGSFSSSNNYLIAFRDELFHVHDSLSVFRVPEFCAIGSGGDFAIAAMHLGHDSPAAAGVAAELDIFCSGKIETFLHNTK